MEKTMYQYSQPRLMPDPKLNEYVLLKDYSINILDNEICVPAEFSYNGGSIPKIAWQITYSPFDPNIMLAALVHDFLYANHQTTREVADEIFKLLLIDSGVSKAKAFLMHKALRIGGGGAWENTLEDKIYLQNLYEKVKNNPNFKKYKLPPEAMPQDENITTRITIL